MSGKFISSAEAEREKLEWGTLGWLSRPPTTKAKQLVVIEVDLMSGFGHNFHKHPQQEEVLYVVSGQVEQWLEQQKRLLAPGDSVFIGADVVHASFNVSDKPARLLAILGPCIGQGYEVVEVGDQMPWKNLR